MHSFPKQIGRSDTHDVSFDTWTYRDKLEIQLGTAKGKNCKL
jgi:hypothetical protein